MDPLLVYRYASREVVEISTRVASRLGLSEEERALVSLLASSVLEGVRDGRLMRILFYYLYGGRVKLSEEDRRVLDGLRREIARVLEKYRNAEIVEAELEPGTYRIRHPSPSSRRESRGEDGDFSLLLEGLFAGA